MDRYSDLKCEQVIIGASGDRFSKVPKLYRSFRVSQFPLYLKNGDDLSRQTSQLVFLLLP